MTKSLRQKVYLFIVVLFAGMAIYSFMHPGFPGFVLGLAYTVGDLFFIGLFVGGSR
ncbi:hypothetical protein [Dictyobacter arantiisoli]|uniref:Uncharacterized protein n=1 Tax=Dictyobacter arantiisoli TaxID=2014874 RepID=A0A5A5TIX6_9CHLR|nr:hypothetical protein [Dictyobacter arantiisoli]GCF10894.1 hypothetical protein KDI_44580 [Dictyobacter arantiisoli]